MYKITIEKIEEVTVTESEYQITGTKPVIQTWGNNEPRIKNDGSIQLENIGEYISVEKKREKTTKIYEQVVETLDIVDVIEAINRIDD